MEIPPLPDSTILVVEVGSTAHGTGLPGGEDLDLTAVVVESAEEVLGLAPGGPATIMQRTQPEGVRSGPGDIDRTVHPEEVEAMRAFVAPRIPDLPGTLLQTVTCMYTNTPDEHFVIARHPGHEQVVVACGFSGHGFKFVPVVGEIVADLVSEGTTAHPIGLFDPGRFAGSAQA